MLALSAGLLVSTFRVKDCETSALLAMLLGTFPSATATMFFRYTTVYYGIAILLAVLAAWVMRYCKYGVLLSACCTALSLGIYQAYVPLTIGIMVLMLLQDTLEGKETASKLIFKGLSYCAALILGLLFYYGCLQLLLRLSDYSLSFYQGVNKMGRLEMKELPALIWRTFSSACTFAVKDYCNLASIKLLKNSYLVLTAISLLIIGAILFTQVKKVENAILAAVLCGVFPVAINFIVIMCPVANIYTLMVYAFVLVPCLPFVVCGVLQPLGNFGIKIKSFAVKGIGVVAAIVIACNVYYANVNYSALYFANRQVENYLSTMIAQVRMTEGFDAEKKWAFIGQDIEDPLLGSLWDKEANYGGNANAGRLLNMYSRESWIENYIGYRIPDVDEETMAQLYVNEEVMAMPCWPSAGSVKVVDDVVVIKLQQTDD